MKALLAQLRSRVLEREIDGVDNAIPQGNASAAELADGYEHEGHDRSNHSGGASAWRDTYTRQIKDILASLNEVRSSERSPHKVVVGGVGCAEAVTKIVESLSIASATDGLRVLAVDANVEAPQMHLDFDVENDIGVSTLLCSSDPPHRMIKKTEFPNLDLMTSGPRLPEVSSRLARQELLHRLQPVAKRYDFVFVDAGRLEPFHLANVGIGCDNLVLAVKEHVALLRELERVCGYLRGEKVPSPSILIIE
jgi:Mrp family chromosome partitioning ATPase